MSAQTCEFCRKPDALPKPAFWRIVGEPNPYVLSVYLCTNCIGTGIDKDYMDWHTSEKEANIALVTMRLSTWK